MTTQSTLNPQFNTYNQQKCFIAYTHKASWSEDILAACAEVLPRFGLEAWYADEQFEPGRSLKEKVVEMIANARYGIFDLSAMYDGERKEWVMPRNVLIELGIAIALNRPVLLLRTVENRVRGCPLPACLAGIDMIEFGGEHTLKRALEERIPQWTNVSPEKMWWTRYCLFGGCDCEYREVHPRMERWQQEGLQCHVADGADADRVDFRCVVEDEMGRYNDLTFAYLDACKPTHPYHFVQCAHCQTVRSSQFAIYRITPQTDAATYIAIGMSIALETQFGYDIPKIFLTGDVREVPSLLRGYEVIEAGSTKMRKQRLRKALPVVVQRVQECVWRPGVLPFEAGPLIIPSFSVRKEEKLVEEESPKETLQRIVFHKQLKRERELRGWTPEHLAMRLGVTALTVGRWERGENIPAPDFRSKLCEVFGKSLAELGLTGQQNKEAVDEEIDGTITGLQLEPWRRRVWIDGKLLPEPLSMRQFELLQFLAKHAGEVCSREETSEAVYDEKVYIPALDKARLDALVVRTRQHIGDDPRNPRFIETVGRKGHRLNEYIGFVGQRNSGEAHGGGKGTVKDANQEEEHVVGLSQPVVFHKQLRRERELRGWAQAYLATRLGVAPRIVDLWERGEAFPDSAYRNLLCEVFGKSLEEFGLLG